MNLYDNIVDSFENPRTIGRLASLYAKSEGSINFYELLTATTDKQNRGKYDIGERDRLFSSLFNIWKRTVVEISGEQYDNMSDEAFTYFQNYLQTLPDAATKSEVERISSELFNNPKLSDVFDRYRFDSEDNPDWKIIKSELLSIRREEPIKVEHRLYLNVDPLYTHRVLNAILAKCSRYNRSFSLKFDEYGIRDETIVIYCSSENILFFLKILREIKEEAPELANKFYSPPLLSGRIDNWIGYGSEPKRESGELPESFNGLRSNIIYECFQKSVFNWWIVHFASSINVNGKAIVLSELLANELTEFCLVDVREQIEFYSGTQQKIDFTMEDISSPSFAWTIKEHILASLKDILNFHSSNGFRRFMSLDIPVYRGKVKINSSWLLRVLPKTVAIIIENDNRFLLDTMQLITSVAQQNGIDSQKFCCDTYVVDKLKKIPFETEMLNETGRMPVVDEFQKAIDENIDSEEKYNLARKLLEALPSGQHHLAFVDSQLSEATDEYLIKYWKEMLITLAISEMPAMRTDDYTSSKKSQ